MLATAALYYVRYVRGCAREHRMLFAEHDEAEVRVVRRCVRDLSGCAH